MFLELTELLVCPACRPAQGLVALVERMEGRRVVEGFLGCAGCEARYPIRSGEVHFGGGAVPEGAAGQAEAVRSGREPPAVEDSGADRPGGAGRGRASPEERALLLAALLGLQEGGGGVVLLGRGLARAAAALARLAAGMEVLALADAAREPADGSLGAGASGSDRGAGRTTTLVGVPPDALPLFSGRLRGVALVGGRADDPAADGLTEGELGEGVRVLATGGRLAVLRPGAWVARRAAELGMEVLAAEERALVAVRR